MTLSDTDFERLAGRLHGELIGRGDPRYDEARRIWNGTVDKHPALIARCRGTADVVAAVNFAREQGLPVSVRGGGHNVAGRAICDDGLVIDLSRMTGVRVDPARRLARVEGGATLGDVDHETAPFGLAVPLGLVSETGVAGLTLHGGLGQLTRKHGLSADNLVAADVVTADGRLLLADAEHHQDLLWALRGGGGNFGVVTSFEFRLHPVAPEVWVTIVMYPLAQGPKVLGAYRDFIAQAPDEVMSIALLWSAPDEEHIPAEQRGSPVVVVAAWYAGSAEEGERVLQPLREIDAPVVDLSGAMSYPESQRLFDADYPDGRRYYWKSVYLDHLDDEVMQALLEHTTRRPSPLTSLDLWALGGAMARVDPQATAFGQRDAPFLLGVEANWIDPATDDANMAWAREAYRDLSRFSSGRTYLNFPGHAEEGEALMRKTYGDTYARLQQIKAKYDPDNFFRSTLNISPRA